MASSTFSLCLVTLRPLCFFYVLEKTRIGGVDYILVTDQEEGDGEALILKDISEDSQEEGVYTIVCPPPSWRSALPLW